MIRIITDSTCDLNKKEAAALGIEIVPLTVRFGEEEFLDGVSLTHEEFYQRLQNCKELPVTSQPSPFVFSELFSKYIAMGDQILGIFISSKLSGTFQAASLAADMVKEKYSDAKIALVDSKNVSIGTALLLREAVRLRENGLFLDELADSCTDIAAHIRLFAMAGSLTYLQKGGRLSSSAAFVGSLLKITPVIEIIDGKVEIACKARGKKSAASFIEDQMKEADIIANASFIYGHADAETLLDSFQNRTKDAVSASTICTGSIGCIVGTHIGPGSFGIAYLESSAVSDKNILAS